MKKNKKLQLVSLDWTRPKDPPLSLGHASILANLRHHAVEDVTHAAWSVNNPQFSINSVLDFLFTSPTTESYAAFGAFVWNEKAIQEIIQTLRKEGYPGKILLGGPQVSYVNTNDIEHYYPHADVFIRGYGEDVITQFMMSKESQPDIQGIQYAGQQRNGNGKSTAAIVDLNTLPSPFLMGIIPKQRFLRWETQRGCPFRCSFCQHRESDPINLKRKEFAYNRIQQEIDWIVEDHIVQDLAVLDPTFNTGGSGQYLNILKRLTEKKYSGKIALQCRLEMVTMDFLDHVEALNQTSHVVLEFGLQTIHKKEQFYIQRPNNLKKIERILEEVNKRKIDCEISLIFGLPGQTLQTFQESVDYCLSHHIKTIHAFPLMLLRGTKLFDQKQDLGLIESSDVNIDGIPRVQEGISHVITSPSFSYNDWLRMSEIAQELEKRNQQA
eukprot:gene754-818_t